jgi:hypothetical protein
MVNQEAEKGQKQDTMVFGMAFGDTKKDFFDRCWQLNNQGKVTQGPNNKSVQYLLSSGKENDNLTAINMLFYGTFDTENIMVGMDMEFSYKAWSLWNKKYDAQKLLPVLKDTLMNWFPGNAFIPVESEEEKKEIFVKVDGNRQILIYPKNDKDVAVKIEDLTQKYPDKFQYN